MQRLLPGHPRLRAHFPCFISMSMKCAPSLPALRLMYAGLLPATSSAASRCFSCVSAGGRARGERGPVVRRCAQDRAHACLQTAHSQPQAWQVQKVKPNMDRFLATAACRPHGGYIQAASMHARAGWLKRPSGAAAVLNQAASHGARQALTALASGHRERALCAHQVGLAARAQNDVVLHPRVALAHKHVGVLQRGWRWGVREARGRGRRGRGFRSARTLTGASGGEPYTGGRPAGSSGGRSSAVMA